MVEFDKDFYSVSELAAKLGVSEMTIRRKLKDIGFTKFGKQIRIDKDDILGYIHTRKGGRPAMAENDRTRQESVDNDRFVTLKTLFVGSAGLNIAEDVIRLFKTGKLIETEDKGRKSFLSKVKSFFRGDVPQLAPLHIVCGDFDSSFRSRRFEGNEYVIVSVLDLDKFMDAGAAFPLLAEYKMSQLIGQSALSPHDTETFSRKVCDFKLQIDKLLVDKIEKFNCLAHFFSLGGGAGNGITNILASYINSERRSLQSEVVLAQYAIGIGPEASRYNRNLSLDDLRETTGINVPYYVNAGRFVVNYLASYKQLKPSLNTLILVSNNATCRIEEPKKITDVQKLLNLYVAQLTFAFNEAANGGPVNLDMKEFLLKNGPIVIPCFSVKSERDSENSLSSFKYALEEILRSISPLKFNQDKLEGIGAVLDSPDKIAHCENLLDSWRQAEAPNDLKIELDTANDDCLPMPLRTADRVIILHGYTNDKSISQGDRDMFEIIMEKICPGAQVYTYIYKHCLPYNTTIILLSAINIEVVEWIETYIAENFTWKNSRIEDKYEFLDKIIAGEAEDVIISNTGAKLDEFLEKEDYRNQSNIIQILQGVITPEADVSMSTDNGDNDNHSQAQEDINEYDRLISKMDKNLVKPREVYVALSFLQRMYTTKTRPKAKSRLR